jgi:hypothetical protein
MKVNLCLVPPGGGEVYDLLTVDMSAIPQQGDYITIRRQNQKGTEDFVVRRTWWDVNYDEEKKMGGTKDILVECEFAIATSSTESHKEKCGYYHKKTGNLKKFDKSMY